MNVRQCHVQSPNVRIRQTPMTSISSSSASSDVSTQQDKVTMFRFKAGVLLLPSVVGPQYILTIQVLPHGATLYRHPTVRQYMGASSNYELRRPSLRAGMAYRHAVLL